VAARLRFAASMSVGVSGRMGSCMRVYARVYSDLVTGMHAYLVRDGVRRMSGAMPKISQQRRYDKVDQPDQETANKHK
jgi:hypothetical protein